MATGVSLLHYPVAKVGIPTNDDGKIKLRRQAKAKCCDLVITTEL